MARGNRAANRAAAKAMLETMPTPKEVIKAEQQEQLDFFSNTQNDIDLLEDEEEVNLGGNDEEKEGEAEVVVDPKKANPATAPSVDNGEEEAEDDGDEFDTEGDDEEGGEVGDAAAGTETTTDDGKPKDVKAEPEKPAEPAPKDVKAEETPKSAPTAKIDEPFKPLSEEEQKELYDNWRGQTEDLLAQHHYRLDEKAVEELNANPAAYIPKAMARVYMDSISAAFQQFSTYLPRMVDQVLVQRERTNADEKAFFERWPDLVGQREVVWRIGQAYRQANPSATKEAFINEVGAQAMVALRLVPNGQDVNLAKPGSTASANGKNKTDERKPFKPATEGSGPATKPRAPSNPFEQLASEFTSEYEEDLDDN